MLPPFFRILLWVFLFSSVFFNTNEQYQESNKKPELLASRTFLFYSHGKLKDEQFLTCGINLHHQGLCLYNHIHKHNCTFFHWSPCNWLGAFQNLQKQFKFITQIQMKISTRLDIKFPVQIIPQQQSELHVSQTG